MDQKFLTNNKFLYHDLGVGWWPKIKSATHLYHYQAKLFVINVYTDM